MHTTSLLCLFLLSSLSQAVFSGVRRSEENGPCTGKGGAPGVCISTGSCIQAGGDFIDDACPDQKEDIKCCNKTACGTGSKGNCRFTSSCSSGNTETNQCPGPATFKCCMPASSGGGSGNYPAPDIPNTSSGCKKTAIEGAKKIVDKFPGKVREIGCIRDCESGDSSDHCDGMATDMMVAEGGVKTDAGQPIAEWVKDNCADLSCKYVMWGQKIWEKGVTSADKKWEDWPYQNCLSSNPDCVHGDRGDNTANHWDHVHVSY